MEKLNWQGPHAFQQKQATIAVDLDGTLAKSRAGVSFDPNHIGAPVKKMMARVKDFLEQGKDVALFTARASDPKNIPPVRRWLDRHGLQAVKITHEKTPDLEVIYDDRAKGVHKNRGTIKSGEALSDPTHRYTNVHVGKKHPESEKQIHKYLQQIEQNMGVDLSGVPILASTRQPLRNLKRYFIPNSLRQIPSRLFHTGQLAGVGAGVAGGMFSPVTAGIYGTSLLGAAATKGTFYQPAFGTINTTEKSYPILAHEIGHWADFEKRRGPYARTGLGLGILFSKTQGSPKLPKQLVDELNASLFALQSYGKKAAPAQDKAALSTALASYLANNTVPLISRSFKEWRDGVPKFNFKNDKNWKKKLQEALYQDDETVQRAAMRTALVSALKVKKEQQLIKELFGATIGQKLPLVSFDKETGGVKWNYPRTKGLVDVADVLLTTELERLAKQKKNGALAKTAELPGVQLQPHQARLVRKITKPETSGILAQHGLGAGKTLGSIAAWDALGRPDTAVIVPAALQENYRKELKKWVGYVPENVHITSQQRVARQRGLPGDPPAFMIVDEQHKARDQSSALRAALAGIKAKKRLLLTGTPIYNHPHDLAATINLAAGKTLLPSDKGRFNERYVKTTKVKPPLLQRLAGVKPGVEQTLKNTGELRRILKKYIDYHPNSSKGFPSSTEETINVPMKDGQTEIYNSIMGKAPRWVRWKVKSGLPPGKGEFEAMRAFLTGARQVSNTNREFTRGREEAAKVDVAFNYLRKQLAKDPDYKALVYSNYLNSGLVPYKERLARAGIPFGEFSGEMDRAARDETIRQYNANKLRALLISSAGAEGLDLKRTRLIQLLEPHFNEEKEKQIIGRGIRYGSHEGLPPEQRHVLVQRYLAQPKGNWLDRLLGRETNKGADEYIRNLALQKSKLNNQVHELLLS